MTMDNFSDENKMCTSNDVALDVLLRTSHFSLHEVQQISIKIHKLIKLLRFFGIFNITHILHVIFAIQPVHVYGNYLNDISINWQISSPIYF